MKRCINTIVAIIALGVGLSAVGSNSAQLYTIVPTTVGDNAIVNAIKQYSNITARYVNRWKPFGLWIIGPSLRAEVVNVINNYIRVCQSLTLAHTSFEDEESLKRSFPINWTVGALCVALQNLKDQGMYALALLAQVGANSDDVKGLDNTITSYLTIIDHNRNVLKPSCNALAEKRMERQDNVMKGVLAQATLNEKRWKNATAQAKIVSDIKAVADVIKGGMATSVPTALLGAALYWTGVLDTSNTVTE